jgi:hypothetical protein
MPVSMPDGNDPQTLLYAEGDRLARRLAQTLGGGESDVARAHLIGLSLAVNLVNALLPTVEQVTRHAGKPLHAQVVADGRGRTGAGGCIRPSPATSRTPCTAANTTPPAPWPPA